MSESLHIVFISEWYGFPHGYAASQRVGLLGRALVEHGARVTVLVRPPTEYAACICNTETVGEWKGVAFRYLAGTTSIDGNKFRQAWHEWKGALQLVSTLVKMKRSKQIDVMYLWDSRRMRWLINLCTAHFLAIPVVYDFNESPRALNSNPTFLDRFLSPIFGAAGLVVISHFLMDWIAEDQKRWNRQCRNIHVPILVDADEQPEEQVPLTKELLFAGDPSYRETILFLLDVMMRVQVLHPDYKLVITGFIPGEKNSDWLRQEIDNRKSLHVELSGYLSRTDLLKRYRSSYALLIPLFDNVRSKARFPTKIGEYLASGRPVITNDVGEIPAYFTNREDALFCEPGNPQLFADLIHWAVEHPESASSIGERGRGRGRSNFHYSHHGRQLISFLRSLKR